MLQCIDRCKERMSAKLVVEAKVMNKTLDAFTPILQEICQGVVVTEEALLTANPFNLTFREGCHHQFCHQAV